MLKLTKNPAKFATKERKKAGDVGAEDNKKRPKIKEIADRAEQSRTRRYYCTNLVASLSVLFFLFLNFTEMGWTKKREEMWSL